jgi:hypothetical protein
MPKTPLEYADLRKHAGTFVTVESAMFDLMPEGATIVVGGVGLAKPTSYPGLCFLCGASLWRDRRDDEELVGLTLCILCPECFFKMEPTKET